MIILFLIKHKSIEPSQNIFAKEKTNVEFPVNLKIPSIGVDATVEKVSLTSAGEMDVPKQPDNVAWFDLGSSPGQKGSAVIDGHSGWKDNKPAVFDNLSKLKKGDKMYVENNTGIKNTFVVREIKDYDPNGDDRDVFYSSDELSHLNLITCSGAWNVAEQTHSRRLVVFTDKEI